jgi:hypothetical protein
MRQSPAKPEGQLVETLQVWTMKTLETPQSHLKDSVPQPPTSDRSDRAWLRVCFGFSRSRLLSCASSLRGRVVRAEANRSFAPRRGSACLFCFVIARPGSASRSQPLFRPAPGINLSFLLRHCEVGLFFLLRHCEAGQSEPKQSP